MHQDKDRRQHKERSCGNASQRSVRQPACVDRKLLGFGTGQEHAEVESLKGMVLSDPLPLVHQLLVHYGDLTYWRAEANKA